MKLQLCLIVLFSLIFLIGCTENQQKIVCNSPYILVGSSCCFDQNSNNLCDILEDQKMDQKFLLNDLKLHLTWSDEQGFVS